MPYRQTPFTSGQYYHLYNRGVGKRELFKEKNDFLRFLEKMQLYSQEFGVEFFCFCLIPNHFHFLVLEKIDGSISQFMQKLGVSYAMYFNLKYENVGPIFQGRFKAKLIDKEEYLLHLSRYIHQNPAELIASIERKPAEFVSFIRKYPWSSYLFYLDLRKKTWVNTKFISDYFSRTIERLSYRNFVESPILAGEIEKLKPYLIDI
ncbi:MAG: transposase [Candidatus Berkelbacteria bacterium Licking1014_7]|uniref:Transposase n=1 Tax=Candidatus Berkelbacteria bacterium Licking1014_7 TaxID=2017147 RepID=A0A554LIM4_9BACT|nr:MAG: transposase [Candidatus Berkelbacteria bacterium Licking1014_7]